MAKFLIIGWGSIGKRHGSILQAMGHEVVSVDPAPGAMADYIGTDGVTRNDKVLKVTPLDFAGVLDCTPSNVRAGYQVPAVCRFIEKPVGFVDPHTQACLFRYQAQTGFNYYYSPSLRQFVTNLEHHRIYHVAVTGGSYLPDWHEGDYRDRYHGGAAGGVVNDSLPHSLFVARWILGDLELVGHVTGKMSSLDIHTEDVSALLLRAPTGQPCYIVVDYLREPGDFRVEAVTSSGVKTWVYDPEESDAMYWRQMEVFCELAAGTRRYGYPDLREGLAVQRVLDAMKEA